MLKKLRKSTCFLVATLLLFSSINSPVYAVSDEAAYVSSTEEEIERLFDQRATVLAQIFNAQGRMQIQLQNSRLSELNAIDMQLIRNGVTFLSSDEVYAQFPETKNDKALALSGQTLNETNSDALAPLAVAPDSTVNNWASYRSTYTSNGTTYNIQKLVAQPTSPNSPLAETGSKTVTFSTNWQAGTVNVFSTLAKAGVGALVGEIPGANFALTFLDAVESFVTGISTTTEVDVPHIVYSWSLVTTASFMYVRQNSQTDAYQWLSLICTKATTNVGYQLPRFSYTTSNGTSVLTPEVIQGNKMIYNTPSNYNSNSLAVTAYTSVSGGPLQNCIDSIDITAPEANRIEKIYPCYPAFPSHCEP